MIGHLIVETVPSFLDRKTGDQRHAAPGSMGFHAACVRADTGPPPTAGGPNARPVRAAQCRRTGPAGPAPSPNHPFGNRLSGVFLGSLFFLADSGGNPDLFLGGGTGPGGKK